MFKDKYKKVMDSISIESKLIEGTIKMMKNEMDHVGNSDGIQNNISIEITEGRKTKNLIRCWYNGAIKYIAIAVSIVVLFSAIIFLNPLINTNVNPGNEKENHNSTQDINDGLFKKIPKKDVLKSGELKSILNENVTKSISLDKITHEYELLPMLKYKAIYNGIPSDRNWVSPSLQSYNFTHPIEYIRMIDDNNALVIYKTRDPLNNLVYMYCFFENYINGREELGLECWVLRSRVMFACKNLSYSDFSDIKIGSNIDEVYGVDPVVSKYVKIDDSFPYQTYSIDDIKDNIDIDIIYVPYEPKSFHLLTDGLLIISYEYKDGEHIVSDIQYDKNYMMYDEVSKEEKSRKILETELPN